MLVMNIIISVLSSSSPCCWRLDVNAILAEVFLLLIIIIYCLGDLLFFLGRFFASVGTPSLFISVYNLTFSVEMWGENKKRSVLLHVDLLFFAFPLV